jgi:pimeloyl-ACP methyl ester carboxylesterase
VELPSSGSPGTLDADADVVRAAIAATDEPTYVVGHSYGGAVITAASAGTQGIAHLVYLCAFMLDEGESLLTIVGENLPEWILVDQSSGTSTLSRVGEFLYGACPADVVAAAEPRLKPQSLASFAAPVGTPGWREHPSTYLVCERDLAVPLEAQEAMCRRAGNVDRTDTDHMPMYSATAVVADLIKRVAGVA